MFFFAEPTPYTASLRELKNEVHSVFFNEPTPYTASLRELLRIFTEPTPYEPTPIFTENAAQSAI